MALSVLSLAVAFTVGTLTKINAFAASSRNASGAYAILINEVDLFQSMSPFNPQLTNQDGSRQIPKDTVNVRPTYDMNTGTRTLSVDGTSNTVPVYQFRDPNGNAVQIVPGTLTETVTDISSILPNTYQAVFTLTYSFRNRNYSYTVSTIRTSDT